LRPARHWSSRRQRRWRPNLAPVPAVSIGVASQIPVGESSSFTVTFDNTSGNPSDVGYGPILDLILPINGADGNAGTSTPGGITSTNASYLGVPLTSTVLPFPDADGPGPSARLQDLRWGDRIIVRAYGQAYTYEVRTVQRVNAGDLRPLGHKDQPWLTRITCHTYDGAGGRYLHRMVVQAVLVEVADG